MIKCVLYVKAQFRDFSFDICFTAHPKLHRDWTNQCQLNSPMGVERECLQMLPMGVKEVKMNRLFKLFTCLTEDMYFNT